MGIMYQMHTGYKMLVVQLNGLIMAGILIGWVLQSSVLYRDVMERSSALYCLLGRLLVAQYMQWLAVNERSTALLGGIFDVWFKKKHTFRTFRWRDLNIDVLIENMYCNVLYNKKMSCSMLFGLNDGEDDIWWCFPTLCSSIWDFIEYECKNPWKS